MARFFLQAIWNPPIAAMSPRRSSFWTQSVYMHDA